MYQMFLNFTISGKQLPVEEMRQKIGVPASIYHKNEIIFTKWGRTLPPQKNNRWVYSLESCPPVSVNSLLKKLYRDLLPYKSSICEYTRKNYSMIEIIIYTDFSKSNSIYTNLTMESISIIKTFHSKFSLVFIDSL